MNPTVATPSVRPCYYAMRSRRHVGSTSAFCFVDVLKCGPIQENAAQYKIFSLQFGYPSRVIPTYLAVGAQRSRPVFTPIVASKLVPTPLFLLLLCVGLPHSPAEDGNSLQSYRHTHLLVLVRVKQQKARNTSRTFDNTIELWCLRAEVSHPHHNTYTLELSRSPRPAFRCNTRLGRRTRIDGQRQKTE